MNGKISRQSRGREQQQQWDEVVREYQAECHSGDAQQQAFQQSLLNQASASRAQGDLNRDFVLAS